MTTNILSLGEVSIPCSIHINADWIDAIAFFDPNGNPLPLDGIGFRMQARSSPLDGDVLLEASTANGLLGLGSTGALAQALVPGLGYAIGDGIALNGGVGSARATLAVTMLALGAALLTGSGAGHTVGDVLTLAATTPGVAAAPATVQVDAIDGNGRITAFHVLAGGAYTVAPIALTQAATTGLGTGAAFGTPSWGVAAAKMTSPGTYSVTPTNPIAQSTSTGAGQGATFALTWINNVLAIQVPLASMKAYLVSEASVYEIRAEADSYIQVAVSGALTPKTGIVQ